MLSLFPQILFLAPFSALLIRVALALIFVLAAWGRLPRGGAAEKALGIVELAVAAAILIGIWTQAAALAGALLVILWLAAPRYLPVPKSTAFLSLVLCLSLLVTGAGALAFDLPL